MKSGERLRWVIGARHDQSAADIAGWEATAGEIRAAVEAGRSVTVTWEVR